ncbi:ATG8-interacting protein 2-like protein [Tanacetum coccineum]|uniref:ATG8-interacting protein 2-like protein n=1 Tax=Tanacetum coccineum TaxID=301880 RepID=A0ABQ5EU95_9ASTR
MADKRKDRVLPLGELTGKWYQSLHQNTPLHQSSDSASVLNTQNLPKQTKEDNLGGSGPSYASWLKKQVTCLYAHAKETNTLWPIIAAAAVMGIVVIGQWWHQEKWQVLHHELKSRTHDEYIGGDIKEAWKVEPAIKVAFERFKGRLKKIEDIIDTKNANLELRNRSGVGLVPYQLLKPNSVSGVIGMVVPNSISIYSVFAFGLKILNSMLK